MQKESFKDPKYIIFNLLGIIFIFGLVYGSQREEVVEVEEPLKVYKVGFITDAHAEYSEKKYNGAIRPESALPMQAFLERMNNDFRPDFVVEGGDFIEGTNRIGEESVKDFTEYKKIYDQIEAPGYHVVGNHDLRGFEKSKWKELTGNKNSYYYFTHDNLLVLVMDSNYKPMENVLIDVDPYEFYTRGYFAGDDIAWADRVFNLHKDQRKIVFVHHPPLSSTNHKAESDLPVNAEKVREVFEKHGVEAVFSGHIEEKYEEEINGVKYFVMPGFYKSLEEESKEPYGGVFSEIELGENVKVRMFYTKEEGGEYFQEEYSL